MSSNPKPRWRLRPKLVVALLLGPLTTAGIAWASAAWVSLQPARGTVALDGDHLRPWLIRLERVSATRVIWFEKGRIWGPNPLTKGGPSRVLMEGTQIALNCWSFAISTRMSPRYLRGEVVIPRTMKRLVAPGDPDSCWGAACDERGWPLPALRAQVVGTLDPSAGTPLTCSDGIILAPSQAQRESLATVRALPLAPIWGGLLADSGLFAGSWWLALTALGRGVSLGTRLLAARAGRCPQCRYDLKGALAPGCPECGWNREQRS